MKTHSTLLQNLPALYEAQTLESLPRHLLKFLRQVISADAIAYNEVQPATGRAKVISDPMDLVALGYLEVFAAHMGEHPLITHQKTTRDFSARKISDFLSRADYHRLGIYQEVYRHLKAEDQFALNLDVTPDTIVALAMNRSRRNFTENDRETLNWLRPHLLQVYRNAHTLSRLQTQMTNALTMMDKLPVGLVILDRRGQSDLPRLPPAIIS